METFHTEIKIGGKISQKVFLDLFEAAKLDGLCLVNDPSKVWTSLEHLDTRLQRTGGVLHLVDYERPWGKFEAVENVCDALELSYAKFISAKDEYPATLVGRRYGESFLLLCHPLTRIPLWDRDKLRPRLQTLVEAHESRDVELVASQLKFLLNDIQADPFNEVPKLEVEGGIPGESLTPKGLGEPIDYANVVVCVVGGVVQNVDIKKAGIIVQVLDYDVEGNDEHAVLDEDGIRCVESVYRE